MMWSASVLMTFFHLSTTETITMVIMVKTTQRTSLLMRVLPGITPGKCYEHGRKSKFKMSVHFYIKIIVNFNFVTLSSVTMEMY